VTNYPGRIGFDDHGKDSGRSHDRSPRSYHEPRQTSGLLSLAPLAMIPPQLLRDTQFVEDYRRAASCGRVDRNKEGHSPTLPRNTSNAVAPRSQPSGRYDERRGQRPLDRQSHVLSLLIRSNRVIRYPSHQVHAENVRLRGSSPLTLPPSMIYPKSDRAVRALRPTRTFHRHRISQIDAKATQPEFMLSLPPPSTRLPGALPPVLPPHPCGPPQDQSVSSLATS